jgi:hypothetical protein
LSGSSLSNHQTQLGEGDYEELLRLLLLFLFTYEIHIHLLLSPLLLSPLRTAGMLVFVLGLLLGFANPAKEEEREFQNIIYRYRPRCFAS